MSDLRINFKLQESLLSRNFVLKTQQQIAKDFAKVNLRFPETFSSEAYTKQEIEELIANEVATLMQKGERQLLQLLYGIDLSEKVFLELTTQSDFLAKITEQILFREACNVWLSANFSRQDTKKG